MRLFVVDRIIVVVVVKVVVLVVVIAVVKVLVVVGIVDAVLICSQYHSDHGTRGSNLSNS